MSLSGNLATFSLDEVLLLLSSTGKSGALRVRDATTEGVVYFDGGRLCGAEVDQVSGAVDDVTALEARLVDTCFALARLDDGAFEFEGHRRPPWDAADEVDVAPIVERVRDLLGRWPAIERHVPGLDVTPRLARSLTGDAVTIERSTWPVFTAIDGRASVRALGAALGCSALEVAAALAALVEAGAVTVDTAPALPDLEAQLSALEHVAEEAHRPNLDDASALDDAADLVDRFLAPPAGVPVDELPEDVREDALDMARVADEPVEVDASVEGGVSMLTHDPDALARLNRAELERAALGEPIEDEDAEDASGHDDDVLPEPSAPRPAVSRDRGALLRMFSSLRDG